MRSFGIAVALAAVMRDMPTATELTVSVPLAECVSRAYLRHHRVCPISFFNPGDGDPGAGRERALRVAVAPDAHLDALGDLTIAYGCPVMTVPAPGAEVERLIDALTARTDQVMIELAAGDDPDDADRVDEGEAIDADVRDLANQRPVIGYVNLLFREGYDAGASDVHLEAAEGGGLTVRFRIDGVLVPGLAPPPSAPAAAVVSRIKLLAGLDIAERRRSQDGRIRVRLQARELDLRVSVVHTLLGESVVVRLLDHGGRPVALEALGMSPVVLRTTTRLAERPHGMVLVTGPTGSGKTTTLYTLLGRRHTGEEKIITVEDPVEYRVPGVQQVQAQRHSGGTMGGSLRSILRQDPDVIMVGEMRDAETAEVAIQAAMTGHLVFSTLHTTDAVGAIPRLLDLGIPDYLVAATLEAVLAQRLVRRICDACRATYEPEPERVALLARRPVGRGLILTRGIGCAECRGTGYRGRVGLFELLLVTDELREALSRGARRPALVQLAIEQGMVPLRADGWLKVETGLTTIDEVLRVTTD